MAPHRRVTFSNGEEEVQFDNILSLCERSVSKFIEEEKQNFATLKRTPQVASTLLKLTELLGKRLFA